MTNVIEPLNFSLRKIIKGRSAFPNDDSVYRLIYLGLEQISRKWTMPIKNWKAAAATICDPLRRSFNAGSARRH
jgi:putative transposase